MARKGRNKKKKAKVFNKKKFRNVYCPQCALCDSKASPDFCFNTVYKANPTLFTMGVFPNLIDAMDRLATCGNYASNMSLAEFSLLFCNTGVCTNGEPMNAENCPSSQACYTKFMEQVKLIPATPSKASKKKAKKQKNKRVYTPYATFFCRDSEKFKLEVNRIIYGDNDSGQDKDKELPGRSTGRSDRSSED